MKAVRFFPLAFIANVHGFLIFVPYLALFLAAAHLIRNRRLAVPVPIAATPALS